MLRETANEQVERWQMGLRHPKVSSWLVKMTIRVQVPGCGKLTRSRDAPVFWKLKCDVHERVVWVVATPVNAPSPWPTTGARVGRMVRGRGCEGKEERGTGKRREDALSRNRYDRTRRHSK
jgi:hypothetical protein